ncbi:MAG: hypothetical protein P8H41_01100, partial [Schleiferiaceae bacterium]|nr:hypothetical protein [Schleiferiaceae bacterium]
MDVRGNKFTTQMLVARDLKLLANQITDVALKASPANREALMALPFDDSMTVAEKLTEQTGVIGEKLEIASYEHLS